MPAPRLAPAGQLQGWIFTVIKEVGPGERSAAVYAVLAVVR